MELKRCGALCPRASGHDLGEVEGLAGPQHQVVASIAAADVDLASCRGCDGVTDAELVQEGCDRGSAHTELVSNTNFDVLKS